MSILNSMAMNSALHASNSVVHGTHITPEMGSGSYTGDGTLESTFMPCGHLGEIVEFGSWPAEADGDPQPLQWRIIGKRGDGVKLAITVDIIEQRSSSDFNGDVNWQHSSMRYWLHKVFLPHAFTQEELRRIPSVQLVTFDNEEFKTIGCRGTEDRVFCLSFEEALHFLPTDNARRSHRSGYTKRLPSLPCWWLRSPGGHQFAFQAVNDKGLIDHNGFQATLSNIGVRPALLISPASSLENTDASEPKDPSFCGRHAVEGPGYAIAYADEAAACRELEKSALLRNQPDIAIGGGYPSVLLVHRLLDKRLINTKNCFQLCKSAIHAHEHKLFKRMVNESTLGEYRLGQLLNVCVSEGSLELALFLLEKGANGEGYARAYLPSTTQESTAVCAVAIDPTGALLQWDHVRRHPAAVRQLVESLSDNVETLRGAQEQLYTLPDLLSTCAAQGFIGEVYYLVGSGSSRFSAKQFTEAIQESKFHNHTELTAYLIDRQAELFGSSSVAEKAPTITAKPEQPPATSRRPQLEL